MDKRKTIRNIHLLFVITFTKVHFKLFIPNIFTF